ncbi:MAG: dihydrodipicolinate synthase [Halanaerobium sp. 4-GBenrich]|jgi:4-hydroxy-tetrahydrodipicolinate synthase|uniref:4-hydroxy-tetrahydrodipicolinate synthase n=1 Tax=Halanaerobium congolense TaxID=54121 RepID=A0A1G6MC20_9FIRM|nr:4-hydroxy-tetrahydrodipicolinate synthase [Halanaerobium congolense]KXS49670.1 MAG: dihydrodipicolinate synthase [Halanaerobium sp. T82-1]ODS50504.1 MAG: dihydrodipicolinate synthase [Halanaerobium sp. 4-GBenrich]OEG61793.1 MAG: 4-hydroxy-tetrahydrodipicolinate synthase [Halanaerobium sp. MDAL1]PUU92161.1 MAG: dihydrodipicolinate synthase [Halanaerobium sp.]PTX17242.1 4-hydroxy-tetrahydrodipicolinate synthase [Halanaerobium congolense]
MFKGVGTALITPFKDNGEVDYDLFEKLLEYQLENDVDALVVLGTTGESPTVHLEERKKLTKIAVAKADGKVPVIVGTGTNDTVKVIEMNKLAEEQGADGALIVTPYYNKTSQAGLVDHFTHIARQTELPIIAYNVPSRTGVNIEPDTFKKMAEMEDNIVAIKEASGDMSQILNVIEIAGNEKTILSGNDDQALPLMMCGGSGVISVISNLMPGVMKEITSHILAEEYQAAKDLHYKYLKLMRLIFIDVNPIPIKFAMQQIGFSNNNLRRPLVKLSQEHQELILAEMKEFDIV